MIKKSFIFVFLLMFMTFFVVGYSTKEVKADYTSGGVSILSNLIKNNDLDDDRSLVIPAYDDTNLFNFWMTRKTELFGSNKVYTVVSIAKEVDISYLQVWDIGANGYEMKNSYVNIDLIEIQANNLLLFTNGFQTYEISRATYGTYAFLKVVVPPLDNQEAYDAGYEKGRSDYAEFFPPNSPYGLDGWYGYQDGYDLGYDLGYDYGYDIGESDGYDIGINESLETGGFSMLLSSMFTAVGTLLAIELLPNIYLGMFVALPLIFGVIMFIIGKRKDD